MLRFYISSLFFLVRTCKPLDITNKHDVANFVSTLAGNFDGIVQYNRDNRAFEVSLYSRMTGRGDKLLETLCG